MKFAISLLKDRKDSLGSSIRATEHDIKSSEDYLNEKRKSLLELNERREAIELAIAQLEIKDGEKEMKEMCSCGDGTTCKC